MYRSIVLYLHFKQKSSLFRHFSFALLLLSWLKTINFYNTRYCKDYRNKKSQKVVNFFSLLAENSYWETIKVIFDGKLPVSVTSWRMMITFGVKHFVCNSTAMVSQNRYLKREMHFCSSGYAIRFNKNTKISFRKPRLSKK